MANNLLDEDIRHINSNYPFLNTRDENGVDIITGKFDFSASYDDYSFDGFYYLKIVIPSDYPVGCPTVYETRNQIINFHKNHDSSLCLATPTAGYLIFSKNPTIEFFFKSLLIPFLFSYKYFLSYGKLPFGEMDHGSEGIFSFYKEFFNLESELIILRFLGMIIDNKYRGHHICFCGSKAKFRNCHGNKILILLDVPRSIIAYEFNIMYNRYKSNVNPKNV